MQITNELVRWGAFRHIDNWLKFKLSTTMGKKVELKTLNVACDFWQADVKILRNC